MKKFLLVKCMEATVACSIQHRTPFSPLSVGMVRRATNRHGTRSRARRAPVVFARRVVYSSSNVACSEVEWATQAVVSVALPAAVCDGCGVRFGAFDEPWMSR